MPPKLKAKLAGLALDPRPGPPSIEIFLVATLKIMSRQCPKIATTLIGILFVDTVDNGAELLKVSPEIVKFSRLTATDSPAPRLPLAKGISIQL